MRPWARVRDEDGVALAATIGILGVVTLLVIALLSGTINTTAQTRRDVSWNGALGAAEAGVQDFLFRINSQPDYWDRFPDPSGVRRMPADTTNGALTAFVPVSGAADGGHFTYSVDQRVLTEGRILLTSTGVVNRVTRTVRVTIRRDTFLNYVYAGDYGTLDPELYTTWPPNLFDGEARPPAGDRDGDSPLRNPGNVPDFAINDLAVARAREQCVFHRYDRDRPTSTPPPWGAAPSRFWEGRHPTCFESQFNAAIYNGPFHFNDMISVRGGTSTWTDEATTSWGDGATPPGVPFPGYLDVQSQVNLQPADPRPAFSFYPSVGGRTAPVYRKPFEMPPNNRELRDTADLGGYVFTGPTRIVMGHRDADGTGYILVDSPGTGTSGFRGEIAVPSTGLVVYVEDGPAGSPGCADPDYRPPLGPGPGVEDYLTAMYPADVAQHDITEYDCSAGDAYVEGELMGRLTIGAQSDVVVTWHIGYASIPDGGGDSGYAEPPPVPITDRDMLGLIADGQIRVLKPTRCLYRLQLPSNPPDSPCQHGMNIMYHSGPTGLRTIQDLTIYGALLTTQHSLNVANATMGGSLGTLSLVGTLAEKFSSYTGTPVLSGTLGGGHQVPRDGLGVYTCPQDVNNDVINPGTLVNALRVEPSGQCRTQGGLLKQFIYDERVQYLEPPSFLSPDAVSWVQSDFEERTAPTPLPSPPAPSPAATASP